MQSTLLITVLTLGAPGLKEKPNPAAQIVGVWELERIESGMPQPAQKRSGPLRYQFPKESTFIVLEGEKEIVGARSFWFDPKATPATLEFKIDRSDNHTLGIYKIEGDKLTLCKSPPFEARPREFAAPAGSTNYLMIFRRVKGKD